MSTATITRLKARPSSSDGRRRSVRVQAIADGAAVRAALDQSTLYQRLRDGTHEITIHGERFTGSTLGEVIRRAEDEVSDA